MRVNRIARFVAAAAFAGFVAQAGAKDWEQVRVGVEGAFPPFSYVDSDGELQGFDIDIAHALCKEMEVECSLVQQSWSGIIPGLLVRKYDAIIASMSITEERKKKVAFTDKYYQTPAKWVRHEGADVTATAESLAGKTVGVQRASIGDRYVTDNYGDAVNVRRYTSQEDAFLDMSTGRLDLLFADMVPLQDFLDSKAGQCCEFFGPDVTDERWLGEGIGIAVRKGDNELRRMFNDAIAGIRADGTYERIQNEYFEFDVYGD